MAEVFQKSRRVAARCSGYVGTHLSFAGFRSDGEGRSDISGFEHFSNV